MSRLRTQEWPLVIFTVGLQLAAGLAMVTALEVKHSSTDPVRYIACAIFPFIVLAIVGSLFHVGRPFASWKALRNWSSSRLATELVVTLLFAIAGWAESATCLARGTCDPTLSISTAVLGMAAVISSARIYTISTQPLWNSGWTHVSFVGSALLLGGTAALTSSGQLALIIPARLIVGIGASCVLIGAVTMLRSVIRLGRRRYAAPEAVPVLEVKHWLYVGGLVLLGVLLPLVSVIYPGQSFVLSSATLLLAIVGISLARMLMYSRGTALSRF